MKLPLLRTALLTACLAARLTAQSPATAPDQTPIAEPPPSPDTAPPRTPEEQKKLEEAIRLRLAEHALKKAKPAPATDGAAADAAKSEAAAQAAATPAKENPTMLLPRVEVSKSRVTELAIALQEIDREIAREKKNIKPTALDDSINDPAVAHKLAILGGSSSADRSRLAEERVSLLEAERDITEQIFAARTDAERAELQKQLDDMKTMRRQLERTPKDTRGE
jgi:hypothetical protein